MRVFLIGASGYVGAVVAQAMRAAGHHVVAFARSDGSEWVLRGRGMQVYRGDLAHPASVAGAAEAADVTVYCAAAGSFRADAHAVSGLVEAMAGTGKTLVFTSGSAVVAERVDGHLSSRIHQESTPPRPPASMADRVAIEHTVRAAWARGVRGVVVRPPMVFGLGGSLQVPLMFDIARATGAARYVGPGENTWSTVHVEDLAHLYVLILGAPPGALLDDPDTHRPTPRGRLFHPESGEVAMRDLADAVGTVTGLGPARSWTPEQANAWGPMAAGLGTNSRIRGTTTRLVLGWSPTRPSVLEDIQNGSYTPPPAPGQLSL